MRATHTAARVARLGPAILGGSQKVAPLVLAAILVCAGISDLGLVSLPKVGGMHRQTPGYWPCALGTDAAAFAWGLDLGLGVTTLAAYQAAVAIPVVAFLSGDLGIAVLFTAVYGAARAAAVGAVVLASNADIGDSCTVVSRATPALHRIVGVVALATATAILVVS